MNIYTNNYVKSLKVKNLLEKKLIKEKIKLKNLKIAIGGDGTFLNCVRKNKYNTKYNYIGINTGTLGYYQDVSIKDINNFIKELKENKLKTQKIYLQKTIVYTKKGIINIYSLNEIVIRYKNYKVFKGKVCINNAFLEDYVGDGLIIATPFGSTGYNKSLGGAIMYDTIRSLQITPLGTINNNKYISLNNSLIIPSDKFVIIEPNDSDIIIPIDGKNKYIKDVIKVKTFISNEYIKILRQSNYDFFKKLNNKFLNYK